MRPEFLIPVQLETYPNNIKVKMDERQSLSLLVGTVFIALGIFFFIINAIGAGAVFAGLGAIAVIYTLIGVIQYNASVKANKDDFFLLVRNKVSAASGVEISNAQLAKMWVDGKTKIGGYEVYAQGRQGKFFSVGIY